MTYHGNPVSQGVAVGKAYCFAPYNPHVEKSKIAPGETSAQMQRYNAGVAGARAELEALCLNLGQNEQAAIFESHLDILEDIALQEDIAMMVEDDNFTPEWAVWKVYEGYAATLEAAEDELIRARAADLKDVCNRLLRVIAGEKEKNLANLAEEVIVVTHDLLPSQTAALDRAKVLGIVTEAGGSTSHTAIITRNYGIPAVLGIPGIAQQVQDGQCLALDALEGLLVVEPTPQELAALESKRKAHDAYLLKVQQYRDVKAITQDGVEVAVHLNIGGAGTQELDAAKYTDGVGLFRSEFLYMDCPTLPSEETQFEAYKKVLLTFGKQPVILRTLDIGGDKTLASMPLPKEDNPFLGCRALRLCFARPELFNVQLRAALRASVYGNLWIMLPMISSIDDIMRGKASIEAAKGQLAKEGIAFNPSVKIGIMVETPAIAMLADLAAKEVDFASIGTNDLTQYALAVDRMNPEVAEYYQSYHPAVFRLIKNTADAFNAAGKPLGVCGELGGDPLAAAALVGLGITKLSMNASAVAAVKKTICSLTAKKASAIAKRVCSLPTATLVKAYLEQQLAED